MTDDGTPYTLTRDESELLDLVNLAAEQQFSLTVSHLRDVWTIKLVDIDCSTAREAHGTTFEEAWLAMRRQGQGLRLVQGRQP